MFSRKCRPDRKGDGRDTQGRAAPHAGEGISGGDTEKFSSAHSDEGLTRVRPPTSGRTADTDMRRNLLRAAATSNDRGAFRALVGLLSLDLYRQARTLVQDAYIDDLVQRTLAWAWKDRTSWPAESVEPLRWLVAIMGEVAATAALRRSDTAFGLHLGTEGVDHVEDIDTFIRARAIEEALAKLERNHQELIRRRHLMGQTWETISREMGLRGPYSAQTAYEVAKDALAKHLDVTPSP